MLIADRRRFIMGAGLAGLATLAAARFAFGILRLAIFAGQKASRQREVGNHAHLFFQTEGLQSGLVLSPLHQVVMRLQAFITRQALFFADA